MTSTDKFVGYLVSVECKNLFYQGIVTHIDSSKALIQLKNVFQNGIHCGARIVDIKTTEIENIEILADPQSALSILNPKPNGNTDTKPPIKVVEEVPVSTENENTLNKNTEKPSSVSISPPSNRQQAADFQTQRKPASFNNSNSNGHSNGYGDYFAHPNNNDLNSVNVDTIVDDFDFEKNLALFDKDKFYEEVEGQPKPATVTSSTKSNGLDEPLNAYDSLIKQLNSNGERYHQISVANLFSSSQPVANSNGLLINSNAVNKPLSKTQSLTQTTNSKNYRFDEMVLGSGETLPPPQIQVPCTVTKTYVTDDGFMVPCIEVELRRRLFDESYKQGFSKPRQIECMSRCCAEMAIQLIGGPLRFSPKNNHQKPVVLILANDQSIQGAYAVCTARLLSIRGCNVFLYISKSSNGGNQGDSKLFNDELDLYRTIEPAANTFLKNVDELRSLASIDLILNSFDALNTHAWTRGLLKFIEGCKASVLAIDPACEGTVIKSKWCVLPVMPMVMSPDCGRVYLCDLGFTKGLFNAVNIKYQSPFGAKFLIPLHDS